MAPYIPRSLDLSAYLESLSLNQREQLSHPQSEASSQLIRREEDTIDTDNSKNHSPGPWAIHVTEEQYKAANAVSDVHIQARGEVNGLPPGNGMPAHNSDVDPTAVNMKAIQAIFAIIGASMVLGCIWFFFWAKNGGFKKITKDDWDEYKSTVMRRKGPNGTTLSNATKSTALGGGSVVGQGYSDRDTATSYTGDDNGTIYTGTMTELSSSTAPIIKEKQGAYTGDKRSRNKKSRDDRAKERKKREMEQAAFEGGNDADVRAYMREKPARVGGINAPTDTRHLGTDYTDTESSVGYTPTHRQSSQYAPRPPPVQPHRQSRPPQPPPQTANNRRDFSYTIGGSQAREQEQFSVAPSTRSASPPPMRVPAPAPAARQPQQQQQQPPRYHNAQRSSGNVPGGYAASQASSGYTQPLSELQSNNTKSYHHPLPNLSGGGRTGGYRRGGADLDD